MAQMMYPSTIPPPPPRKEKKELLIFAIYVHIGSQSEMKSKAILKEWKEIIESTFKEVEAQTNYLIKTFVFPVRESSEIRMECVFPKNQEDIDFTIFNKITEEALLP